MGGGKKAGGKGRGCDRVEYGNGGRGRCREHSVAKHCVKHFNIV